MRGLLCKIKQVFIKFVRVKTWQNSWSEQCFAENAILILLENKHTSMQSIVVCHFFYKYLLFFNDDTVRALDCKAVVFLKKQTEQEHIPRL